MKHSFRGALLCLVSAIGLLAVACAPNASPGGGTPNLSPLAMASATPISGHAPLSVAFSSSGSSDTDGSITSYAWDFGDPASGAANTSTDPSPTHTYAAVGGYTATLTVTDDEGATGTATVTIDGLANVAPVAALAASVTSGVAHLPVTFDSAGSTDADGSVASVAWDFGDGHTSNEASAQNLYTVAGTFTATLTVTDGDGAIGTASQTITVTDNPDGRYVATTGTDAGTCLVSASPCRTVQYAVNQTDASGDTVYLASGAYPEIAYVAKDIAFKGANQGIPAGATPGTRRAESIVKGLRTGTSTVFPGAPQRQITIDGIGVDPQGDTTLISTSTNKPLVWLTGGSANVVKNSTFSGGPYVSNCSFTCTTMSDMGLEIRSGGAVVANNSFENFRRVANFYQTAATGTLFTTVSFTGNKLTHYTSRGLQIAPSGGNPSVAGVTVDGNVYDATGFTTPSSPGSIVVTSGANTYTNNTFTGASSGIYLYLCTGAYVVGAQHISSNTFTSNGTAVVVFTENPATCPTAHIDGTVISGNSFAGNAGGIGVGSAATYFANGAGPIDVSCNWWGAATGPNTAGAATATVSASVITSPWTTSLNGACDGG